MNQPPGLGIGQGQGQPQPQPPQGQGQVQGGMNPPGLGLPGSNVQQQQQQQGGGGGGPPGLSGPPGLFAQPQQGGNVNVNGNNNNNANNGGPSPLPPYAQPQLYPQPSIGPPQPTSTTGHMGQTGMLGNTHQPNPSSSVSTIVKAQIVFLLSTLSEETFSRNLSEIRTLISQNAPEMYAHFLKRLIVVAQPVIQGLQGQWVGLRDRVRGEWLDPGTIKGPPKGGAGGLAWRVLGSEAVRASRDGSLGESSVRRSGGIVFLIMGLSNDFCFHCSSSFRCNLTRPSSPIHSTSYSTESTRVGPDQTLLLCM
jgi:hypothetical protein